MQGVSKWLLRKIGRWKSVGFVPNGKGRAGNSKGSVATALRERMEVLSNGQGVASLFVFPSAELVERGWLANGAIWRSWVSIVRSVRRDHVAIAHWRRLHGGRQAAFSADCSRASGRDPKGPKPEIPPSARLGTVTQKQPGRRNL